MKFVVLFLVILGAHFSLTPFAPAPAGAAKFYWPFAADSKPWLGFIGGGATPTPPTNILPLSPDRPNNPIPTAAKRINAGSQSTQPAVRTTLGFNHKRLPGQALSTPTRHQAGK